MPISGVISEILESEGGSIRGEEDFFSVASTMPFVAITGQSAWPYVGELGRLHTFDTKGSHTLVDRVQGIFYINQSSIPKLGDDGPYQFAPAFRCNGAELARCQFHRTSRPYLGENVVKENEYLSAMVRCQ